MTVKRKAAPAKNLFKDVDAVINRGGKTTEDSKEESRQESAETRFTLRIPQEIINEIDRERNSRVGNVSRNQWILEAISESLK